MVQITNTLVAAAIIVPAIAAPVIESREPKGFRSVAKVAGKVASGASLGLTYVLPFLPRLNKYLTGS
ncbi:hypothetical protein CPC08DRAFT_142670 [Agrocybe pediades]|nr:hypothetical protein CPC08DRAFT_142670 [Agrocybe pediades]